MLGPVGKKGWTGMRARLKVPKLSQQKPRLLSSVSSMWDLFRVGGRFAANRPVSGLCSGRPAKGLELLPVQLPEMFRAGVEGKRSSSEVVSSREGSLRHTGVDTVLGTIWPQHQRLSSRILTWHKQTSL